MAHLEEINKFINENPSANIIVNDVETFGDEQCCRDIQRILDHRKATYGKTNGKISKNSFRDANYIVTFSVCCVQKILLQSCDFLGVEKKTSLDWWLWRQICLDNRIYYLNQKLTYWRMHPDSYNRRFGAEERARHSKFVQDLDSLVERREYRSIQEYNKTYTHFTEKEKFNALINQKNILSQILQKGLVNLKILYITETAFVENPVLDASARYRCYHPAEVLNKTNWVSVVSWKNYAKKPSWDYDVYVFHRPNLSAMPLISQLKHLHKILIADYDDLIFGTPDQAKECSLCKNNRVTQEQATNLFISNQRVLFCFDYFTVSTHNLAKEIKRLHTKAIVQVVHNFIPESILALVEKWKLRQQEKDPNLIMYCSGTMSHNRDFTIVEDVFLKSLEKNPKLRLYIFGCLQSSDKILNHPQIYFHSPTSYWNLLQHMARAAYTIAPLEDSCFNDCKSNVKFLESATVGASLLATPIEDIQRMKEQAAIHLLSGPEDWQNCLARIGTDDLQQNIETNYRCLVEHCSTKTFIQEFTNLFKQMEA